LANHSPTITRAAFWRDYQFWAALAAALPFWTLSWWLRPPFHPWSQLQANWLPALYIVLVYPVVEEIVFRGALQGWLMQKIHRQLGPVSAANVLTSVAFTLMHGLRWQSGWSLLVFFPSLVFGYFRERSGALIAPILLHAFYNTGFFLVVSPAIGH